MIPPPSGTIAFASATFFLVASTASAQSDPRLVRHEYRANEIVKLAGKLGVQATIAFEEAEQIENVAVGDSLKWQITPNKRANLLFVKPLELAATTNMTVVTNRRTYLFDLVASGKARPVYMFQFTYDGRPAAAPDPPAPGAAEIVATSANGGVAPASSSEFARAFAEPIAAESMATSPEGSGAARRESFLSFAWERHGVTQLLPAHVYDDGRQTYLTWDAGIALPSIFVAGPNGEDQRANQKTVGTTAVVASVPGRIVLRRDGATAQLDNIVRRPSAGEPAMAPEQAAEPAAEPAEGKNLPAHETGAPSPAPLD